MSTETYQIGNYSQNPPRASSIFEDESVGNSQATGGLVVSRIEREQVFVREWRIDTNFEGEHLLEQFEHRRETQDFDFKFSPERKLSDSDRLDGHDPVLSKQLTLKLKGLP